MTCLLIVDENLFYKAINKKDAAGARIHQQHHSVSDPTDAVLPSSATGTPPPPPPAEPDKELYKAKFAFEGQAGEMTLK